MDQLLSCMSHISFLGSWHQFTILHLCLSYVQYQLSADIWLHFTDFILFTYVCGCLPSVLIILFSWHQYWLVVDFCMLTASSHVEILLRWAHNIFMLQTWVAQIVKKSRSHLNIFGARMVTWSKFLIEDPQILGTIVQNLITKVMWHPEFVHPCCGELYNDLR